MKLGMRVDVDTFRGTKFGVLNLCGLFAEHDIKASFFFSVGPDNMGRHLWRLFRPTFLWKMLRTKAASLYGWDILLRGTFGQGVVIGDKLGDIIRSTSDAGHEIGVHAWDHYKWQKYVHSMNENAVYNELKKAYDSLTKILGKPPTCSAAPGWKCTEALLRAENRLPFAYNSDCRGKSIFLPMIDSGTSIRPQIPVTLPTYDEVIGSKGVTPENYNEYIFSLIKPDQLNVLTIHAESEGIACRDMYSIFLEMAQKKGISIVTLGNLLDDFPAVESGVVVPREIAGREGWVAGYESAESNNR